MDMIVSYKNLQRSVPAHVDSADDLLNTACIKLHVIHNLAHLLVRNSFSCDGD